MILKAVAFILLVLRPPTCKTYRPLLLWPLSRDHSLYQTTRCQLFLELKDSLRLLPVRLLPTTTPGGIHATLVH
ncbi:hypothetical protein I310_05386 [Cryptococcus deuterogattii CA1014]|nr:hypothetical protein I310_05386 [Cryptococcus deuterogattii CA1014]